jgi:hypothetical protein
MVRAFSRPARLKARYGLVLAIAAALLSPLLVLFRIVAAIV